MCFYGSLFSAYSDRIICKRDTGAEFYAPVSKYWETGTIIRMFLADAWLSRYWTRPLVRMLRENGIDSKLYTKGLGHVMIVLGQK